MISYSIEATLEGFRKKRAGVKLQEHQQLFWQDGANTALGAQYKTQIAYYLVQRMSVGRLRELAAGAFDEQHVLKTGPAGAPSGKRGLARRLTPGLEIRSYTEDTYRCWIQAKASPVPLGDDKEAVVTCVLRAADRLLADHLIEGTSLEKLFEGFHGTVQDALERAFDLLKEPPGEADWSHVESEMYGIEPSGQTREWSPGLKAHYKRMVGLLRSRPSVEVTGPHYSGKHSLLRQVYADNRVRGFRTDNGSWIPMFAVSLHETPAAEVIGLVANFYRRALDERPGVEGIPGWLDEISHYARRVPILLIVAGLDAIDDNEIVRALNQDLLGEMIRRIRDEHPDTRLLVSRLSGSVKRPRGRQRKSGFPVLDRQVITFDEQLPLEELNRHPSTFEYDSLRLALKALSARGTAELPPNDEAMALLYEHWLAHEGRGPGAVSAHELNTLAGHILSRMLTPDEARCLALIALSHDGLSARALREIIVALDRSSDGQDWAFDPIDIVRDLPREILHKPNATSTNEEGGRYTIDRYFRDHLLRIWSAENPEAFRLACWGMARSIVIEARRLRTRYGVRVAAARDIQVLIFLLASVNTSSGSSAERAAYLLEHDILPSLQAQQAVQPSAANVIQFASEMLFEGDLALMADNQLLGDARLRLAAVHAFVDHRKPWQSAEITDDPAQWPMSRSHTPWAILPMSAKLTLLSFATAAAARLNLSHLVAHFEARASALAQSGEITLNDFVHLSKIQRCALDAGILFGCDPAQTVAAGEDGGVVTGITLKAVEAMADRFIDDIPEVLRTTPVGRAATSKLRARRAEIIHMSGRHARALLVFEQAGQYGDGHDGGASAGRSEPLVGRSRRMYLRLLVELARAELFERNPRPIIYRDNLALPMLHHSVAPSKWLERAEDVASQSVRDLTVGSISDWIGAKIDRARLSSVRLRYAEALDLLTEARPSVRDPGVGRDMILELLSVHGRTLADAASFAMATACPPRGMAVEQAYQREVSALGRLMGVSEEPPVAGAPVFASQVSLKLCHEAEECLAILKSLTVLPDHTSTRYVIFCDYLGIWLNVVRSRQWISEPGTVDSNRQLVRHKLLKAAADLVPVADSMMATGYLMHWREVRLLATSLATANAPVELPEGFPEMLSNGRSKSLR